MAKIFLSLYSGIPNPKKLPCFYEGFINALLREGNEVMLMVNNSFFDDGWKKNSLHPGITEVDGLKRSIKKFSPDLAIAFNNSLYEDIPQLLECPIAIWGVDSPAIFPGKKDIKKAVDRYSFICATEDFYPLIREHFGAKTNKIHTVYFATDFEAEKIKQDKNISFVGTNFSYSGELKNFFHTQFNQKNIRNDFRVFFESYKNDVLKTPALHAKNLKIASSCISTIPHVDLLNLVSSNFRIQTLHNICDLGLHLYGGKNWYDVMEFSLDLALCYNEQEITTVKDNQDLYNASKIAINITHAQAGKAFGWRVRDAMATNACLVSDYREDLVTQFGKYVKIPTYNTPYEARQVCQKLLKDEIWRQEVVNGSQLAINEAHRFVHRFKDLESIFGIKIVNTGNQGSIVNLKSDDFMGRVEQLMCENNALRFKLALYEKQASHRYINNLYHFFAKLLPKNIKNLIKKQMVDNV